MITHPITGEEVTVLYSIADPEVAKNTGVLKPWRGNVSYLDRVTANSTRRAASKNRGGKRMLLISRDYLGNSGGTPIYSEWRVHSCSPAEEHVDMLISQWRIAEHEDNISSMLELAQTRKDAIEEYLNIHPVERTDITVINALEECNLIITHAEEVIAQHDTWANIV